MKINILTIHDVNHFCEVSDFSRLDLLSASSGSVQRMKVYQKLSSVFGIFCQLKSITAEEILKKTPIMASVYLNDLENSLHDELVQFAELLKTDVASAIDSSKDEALEVQYYKFLMGNSLESCLPNLEITLRIHLSLVIINYSGERSVSTLKRIKNELRWNTMSQERLNYLSLMNIEYNLLREIDANSIVSKFAHIKSRKVTL